MVAQSICIRQINMPYQYLKKLKMIKFGLAPELFLFGLLLKRLTAKMEQNCHLLTYCSDIILKVTFNSKKGFTYFRNKRANLRR